MNILISAVLALTLGTSAPEINMTNICVKYIPGKYIINYDLESNYRTKDELVVALKYHEFESGRIIDIEPEALQGDVGSRAIPIGRGNTIYWSLNKDVHAPYREGEIIIEAAIVSKSEAKEYKAKTRQVGRISKRIDRYIRRMNRNGYSMEEIMEQGRYQKLTSKEENALSYLDYQSTIVAASKDRNFIVERVSIFDLCNVDILETALNSSTRPNSYRELTGAIQLTSKKYDKSTVFRLGLEDVFDFSHSNKSSYSSVIHLRSKKDYVYIKGLKYEIVWGCGLVASVLMDDRKIKFFNSFAELSIFLKRNKNRYKVTLETIGLVGGGLEQELAKINSLISKSPDKFIMAVSQFSTFWDKSSVTKTPRIISFQRVSETSTNHVTSR